MEQQYDNHLNTDGFAFVEFVTNNKIQMAKSFKHPSFTKIGNVHKHGIDLYQQDEINYDSDKQTAGVSCGLQNIDHLTHNVHRGVLA